MSNYSIIRSWNGKTIRQRADSLTDMAQACGKRVQNWTRLADTKEFLEALSEDTLLPIINSESPSNGRCSDVSNALIENKQGGIPEDQGTWGHRLVALEFARWLNKSFAIQCNKWIEDLLTNGKVELTNEVIDQPKLPLPEDRLEKVANAMSMIAKLTGGDLNPTMQQHLKDFAGNLLAGTTQAALTQSKENWMGVVNFAEMELDYQVPQKGNHRRGNLNAWVRCFYPQLAEFGDNKDRRLVNETQQNVWVYPCHIEFVYETLSDAVHEFFCRENPNAELVNAGYFKQKSKLRDRSMENIVDDFLND